MKPGRGARCAHRWFSREMKKVLHFNKSRTAASSRTNEKKQRVICVSHQRDLSAYLQNEKAAFAVLL